MCIRDREKASAVLTLQSSSTEAKLMGKAPVVLGETLLGYLTRQNMVEIIALKSDLAA